MLEAFAWGLLSASSLVIGAVLAMRFTFSQRAIGLVMAFASGVLISAVAYELIEEAVEEHDPSGVGYGLIAGSIVFFLGDLWLDRHGAEDRNTGRKAAVHSGATAIMLGIVLDGIPESAVIGLSLIDGGVSLTVIAAVFVSNLPEGLVATSGMHKGGWEEKSIWRLWAAVAAASAIAAALGFGIFDNTSDALVGFVMAFAAGAILTMLADTMMPEAFEDAGPAVGLVTTLGFGLAFLLQSVE
jgi:ZIP family zinc transporter